MIDYELFVERFTSHPQGAVDRLRRDPGLVKLLHGATGLADEAGEVLGVVKKTVFTGKYLNRYDVIAELGDALFYLTMACNAVGVSIEDVVEANRTKLEDRHAGNESVDDFYKEGA